MDERLDAAAKALFAIYRTDGSITEDWLWACRNKSDLVSNYFDKARAVLEAVDEWDRERVTREIPAYTGEVGPSLVQTIMRVLDHDVSTLDTRQLAEEITSAVKAFEEKVMEGRVKAATGVFMASVGCWMEHHCRDFGNCGCERLAREMLKAGRE